MSAPLEYLRRLFRAEPQRARLLVAALTCLLVVLVFLVRAGIRRFTDSGSDRKRVKRSKSSRSHSSGDGTSATSSSRRSKDDSSTSSSKSKHRHRSKRPDSSLPSMYVLVGIHGSGKSTWAKAFVEKVRKSAIIVCSDSARADVTGSIDDYSREDEVEEQLLRDIEHQIKLRRTIIVDDCQHNLKPAFRQKLLALAPETEYNRMLRRFPMKSLFARARIAKDIAEGKRRYDPPQQLLEELSIQFDAVDAVIKEEGWFDDK